MLKTVDQLLRTAASIYGEAIPQKALRLLQALPRLRAGEDFPGLARELRTTSKNLKTIATASDPIEAVFGAPLAAAWTPENVKKVRLMLGALVIARLAERAFEAIYKSEMHTEDLHLLPLQDERGARTATDFRVLDGQGRALFRINIKFFGSVFRIASERVGLDPTDCFALATYKIKQGLEKQEAEQLPYVFVIVGVPDLTGAVVGDVIPEDMVHFSSFVHQAPKAEGKRAVEDRIVERLMSDGAPQAVKLTLERYADQIARARWYVLSAARSYALMRDKLFERVYALGVRSFARSYRNAELDMHFSLKGDLTPLPDLPNTLRAAGVQKVTHMLATGKM